MLPMLLAMLEDEDDQRRFLKVHAAYEQKMYRVALQVLKSATLAEDAVQQCWVQIIGHFDQVKQLPWEKVEGYVVVTAKNTALRILEKERRSSPIPENWDPPAPADGTGGYRDLLALIRAMPEKYRQVLELKFVLEYSNQEIASLLRMNPATVATYIFRGRNILATRLEQEGYHADRATT
jgi:RNA polymerase sigma-70 factor (ECF subfamily)